jgi:hypothetical protein
MFEGEMVVVKDGVQLMLPDTLKDDPRWERLIDTGIVQLRWQGDDLVLRGLSQQNLLRQPPAPPDRRDRKSS